MGYCLKLPAAGQRVIPSVLGLQRVRIQCRVTEGGTPSPVSLAEPLPNRHSSCSTDYCSRPGAQSAFLFCQSCDSWRHGFYRSHLAHMRQVLYSGGSAGWQPLTQRPAAPRLHRSEFFHPQITNLWIQTDLGIEDNHMQSGFWTILCCMNWAVEGKHSQITFVLEHYIKSRGQYTLK